VEAASADPLVAGAFRIVFASRVTLVLNVGTLILREFDETCRAVIVIPTFTPFGVAAELQSLSFETASAVDMPLLVRARHIRSSHDCGKCVRRTGSILNTTFEKSTPIVLS
jgi:hypothetical protein